MFRTFLFVAMATSAVWGAVPALMPLPVKVQAGAGSLTIDGSFRVDTSACRGLDAAGARLADRIARQTAIPMGITKPDHAAVTVVCGDAGAAGPMLGEDESYTLDVSASGARIQAPGMAGARHGMATLAQLIGPGTGGFAAPAVHVEDRPRFPWRGLMMDVSRHWMPVPVVKRNLDAMAAVKLNVFHWHLSDDQGFRVESRKYPKLQELGSDGHYYSQDELRDVIAYARERGIRVVPEFDIPGHTLSWLAAYPELTNLPGPFEIGRTWGIFDPVMDPTREFTYELLDGFIGEMAAIFPDPFFHIGGDEVNGKVWNESPQIQAFIKAHNLNGAEGLHTYFNQRLLTILEKYGKTMIGWDEILQPDLPKPAMIQSWRGPQSLADAAKQGHRGILSSGYYLDHLSPTTLHYNNEPLSGAAAQLSPEQAALILGGEACMWAEYVSAETVDSRIWPRLAPIAERLWSPKETTDVASMYARMEAVSRNLDWTGVRHRTGYQEMLDRLAGGQSSEPVRVLSDAVEALGLGPRAHARKYTSLVPLNRLVDTARPESENVRALELAAARVVKSASSEDVVTLREQFARWAANDMRFQALANGNILLEELKPLSKALAAVGRMGLQALDYFGGSGAPAAGWVEQQQKEVARMLQPHTEVVLAAARPVKVLLDGLAAKGR